MYVLLSDSVSEPTSIRDIPHSDTVSYEEFVKVSQQVEVLIITSKCYRDTAIVSLHSLPFQEQLPQNFWISQSQPPPTVPQGYELVRPLQREGQLTKCWGMATVCSEH